MDFFKKKSSKIPVSAENVTQLNGRVPIKIAVPLGLQHVLAMFLANIAPMIIVAGACHLTTHQTEMLIHATLLAAGIATCIQLYPIWKIGSGLPIVMGVSFTFVTILSFIGSRYGYATVIGAIIVGGFIEGTLGLFAKYWRKIISPIVASCVVTAIGFSLFSVGATYFGGGAGSTDFGSPQNWFLGTFTLVIATLLSIFGKGFVKQIAILIGLLSGYIVAIFMGMVDLSVFSDPASYGFTFTLFPVMPKFNLGAIISVTLIFLVSLTETFGDTTALAESGLHRQLTDKELAGSIAADGYCSALSGGLFGCLPVTSFSQNVGLVAMTGVVNRFTILMGAIILIIASFFNIIAVFFSTLPNSVLGGCTLLMFGQILITGTEMIAKCGFTARNNLIASLSLFIGMGFTMVPELFDVFPEIVRNIFSQNVVAVVFVIATVLNLILPKDMETTPEDTVGTTIVEYELEEQQK